MAFTKAVHILWSIVVLVLAFAPVEFDVAAQSQTSQARAFEVASIKLSTIRGPQGVQVEYLPGGRFSARGAPIPILSGKPMA